MKKIKSLNKKYHKITTDYDKQKERHLEKLGTKSIKNDEINQKLKQKPLKKDIFKLF